MQQLPAFPPEVHRYVSAVFGQANRRIAEKIARVPNCSEPSVDMTLIDSLTQYAGPRVVAPGWAVRLDVHYLGGLRHFYKWEIADIGILILAKQREKVVAKKVALLQSKRLYPDKGDIVEETDEDFRIGFGTLLPGGPTAPSIALSHTFRFTPQCRYKALIAGDHQYKAIEQYEANLHLPVHYLFYNPWRVPATYHFPVPARVKLGKKGNGGCRVVPAKTLRSALSNQSGTYQPSFADLGGLVSRGVTHAHGWRLEHFVANLVMKCQEGAQFQSLDEENMYALFNRRSGPIAAALAVTVEQYSG